MLPAWIHAELIVAVLGAAAVGVAAVTACARVRQGRALTLARAELAGERDMSASLGSRVHERTAELERRTEQLMLANRELEAFAYSVSHDLRAPLRSVSGFSQALLEDHGDSLPPAAHEHLDRIMRAAGRMSELIDAMLGLARVGRGALEIGPVDISWLARGILADLRAQDPDRHIVASISPGMFANTDKRLLSLVLGNLLGNAWKFTRDRGPARIEVGVTEHDGERAFFVRDNGVGFDAAYSERLFVPFQRLHQPHQFEGIGIGLATAQRAVQHLGGRIWAAGCVGEGATFTFTLGAPRTADEAP